MDDDESAVVADTLRDTVSLDRERLAEPAPREPVEPNGGIVAALVSAGLACALLGILTVVSEASEGFRGLMTLYEPAGPLTGKTTVPVLLWLPAWAFLHSKLRSQQLDFRRGFRTTMVLVWIGLLGTFPPFFQLFGH